MMNAPTLPNSVDIPLHDIKPLMEVPDTSFYYFIALIVIGLLVLGAMLFGLWRYLRQQRTQSKRKEYYAQLSQVDLSNAKRAAYDITRYGYLFVEDGPRYAEAYENLVAKLAPFKYRKEVDALDDETIAYYEIYVGMIDV